MNHSRVNYKRRVLIAFFLATLLVATFFLLFGGLDSYAIRSLKALWNLGHIAYFALIIWLLSQFNWLTQKTIRQQWIIILLFTLLWGIATELLQLGNERSSSLLDVGRDLTGSFVALAFIPVFTQGFGRKAKQMVKIIAVLLLMVQSVPLLLALTDETIARSQFPELSGFDTPFELQRWEGEAGYEVVYREGSSQLKTHLSTALYSGVGMKYFPPDWSQYQYVNLRLYQPLKQPLDITVRIHDAWHNNEFNDRFNKSFTLTQGWNEVRIRLTEVESQPQLRQLDLHNVRDISFFAIALEQPRTLLLDRIYLSD